MNYFTERDLVVCPCTCYWRLHLGHGSSCSARAEQRWTRHSRGTGQNPGHEGSAGELYHERP